MWRSFVFRRRAPRNGYELCLEVDGTVHRWSLDGIMPKNPSAPRVATVLDPESADQLWFEGTADDGPRLIWDAGRFRCEGDFADDLRRGKLRIELVGCKMRGTWALGRRKGTWRGRGHPVILSKEWDFTRVPTDAAAWPTSAASVLSGLDLDDVDGEKRAAAIKSAIAESGAPRGKVAWKGAREIAEPTPSQPFSDPAWLFELRHRGQRVRACHYRRKGHLILSDGGDVADDFPDIKRSLEALPASPTVFEGTLVDDDTGAVLWVHDLLAAGGRDLRQVPLVERKAILAQLVPALGFVRFVDHIAEHGEPLCKEVAARGTEDSIVVARLADSREPSADKLLETTPPDQSDQPSARPAVRMSNRDKIFWPADGFTKGDLLDYYAAIAPMLLPHIADRPVVLVRFPDGIEGRSFFQHHAPGAKSAWLRTVRLKTSRRWRDYFVCESAEDLIYLANLGTIELHGWPSRAGSIERPDFCTLDIDRSKASFADVTRVALAARDLCESIGLPTLVKTSGGEGLHVVIPLAGQLDYDGARILAELLARTLVAELGDIATVEGLIADRDNKVYLDYLVNARGRMLVVPYGVRARPGATVSTPLSWDEVTETLDPRDFTIKTVPIRQKDRPDSWERLLRIEADIPAAASALQGRIS